MPNKLLCVLMMCIACCGNGRLYAQERSIDLPDPALAPRPHVIVLSGIAAEASSDVFQTFFMSAEHPVGPYQNIGLQYIAYLSQSSDSYSYYSTLRKGGYEVGLFSKFFLHGRLSGRRSHLYYGPQVYFGTRKMTYKNVYNTNNLEYNYQVTTTKIMFCLGGQYSMGHAVFEWSLPIGMAYERSNLPTDIDPYNNYNSGNSRNFSSIPSIAIGFRL